MVAWGASPSLIPLRQVMWQQPEPSPGYYSPSLFIMALYYLFILLITALFITRCCLPSAAAEPRLWRAGSTYPGRRWGAGRARAGASGRHPPSHGPSSTCNESRGGGRPLLACPATPSGHKSHQAPGAAGRAGLAPLSKMPFAGREPDLPAGVKPARGRDGGWGPSVPPRHCCHPQ